MSMTVPIPDRRSPAQTNQLQFVLSVMSRHWLMIAIFTVLAATGVAAIGLAMSERQATYEGRTELIVVQTPWAKVLGAAQNTPKTLLDLVSKRVLSEEIARVLVQADLLEGGAGIVAATPDDLRLQAARINAALSVQPIQDTSSIAITCVADTPEDAKAITEIAARVFIDTCNRVLLDEETKTHEFMKGELDRLRVQLEQAENAEWEHRQEMGFRTHDEVTAEMDRMNQELIEAETTRELSLAAMREIERQFAEKNEQLPDAMGEIGEGVVQQLRTELSDLYAQALSMSVVYTPEFKGLQDLQAEIDEKKEALLEAVRQSDSSVASGRSVWEDRVRLREQYVQLQMQITELDIRVKTIEKRLQDEVERLPTLAAKSLEYQKYVREAELLRTQFENVMQSEFDVRTTLNRGSGQIERSTGVDVSEMQRTVASSWWMNALMGAIVGFVFGFCLAVMMEVVDTSIRSIEDVHEYIGLDVIGTIPQMTFGKGRRGGRQGANVSMVDENQVDACIVTQHDPKSPISEAYRALRTKFQFATIQRRPRTILITSAVPGEGKTTTAVNMAVTMADSGMRVLVIDTDLRRPNVHHVLKMERGPGLADVLRQGLDINTVIRPTRIKNLSIISSGRVPPNPSELIGSERMHRVLGQLKGQFDIILCDAPSVLVVTDPVLISTFVDTTVLVVSVNNARRETIIRAKQHLDAANAYIAGVVLNGLEANRRHYYYYYYYYDENDSRMQKRWYHL